MLDFEGKVGAHIAFQLHNCPLSLTLSGLLVYHPEIWYLISVTTGTNPYMKCGWRIPSSYTAPSVRVQGRFSRAIRNEIMKKDSGSEKVLFIYPRKAD